MCPPSGSAWLLHCVFLLALFPGSGSGTPSRVLARSQEKAPEPICRSLSRELTAHTRLAGTVGSRTGARFVARELGRSGFEVELDRRIVLLSHPRRIHVSLQVEGVRHFARTEVFDPHAIPPGDVPIHNAWSASGSFTGPVIDVGGGLRADYERLQRAGTQVADRVVLARYGGAYRGIKAELAQEFGARAILLYNDPEGDGDAKGPTHPRGPWKPGWSAQRGSISSLTIAPGDVSTPGWPSPPPGPAGQSQTEPRRLTPPECDLRLPRILCTPIGADEMRAIQKAGASARVTLDLDLRRELFEIVNVIAKLPGQSEDFIIVGNHRDAWVRGAQDAGSGTVALMRAAQLLGARVEAGWKPETTLVLAFWDAEEFGLVGSTEWGEAHAEVLREHGLCYINADSTVSGLRFRINGSAGWSAALSAALKRVPDPTKDHASVFDGWAKDGISPELGLLGSGSDFTVFVHHLGLPALNFSFRGNGGGQYHTRFDDFTHMDRFLDPTWMGHETAAHFVCELLLEMSARGRGGFDSAEAAGMLASRIRGAGAELNATRPWLGSARAERLAGVFDEIETLFRDEGRSDSRFYQGLLLPEGLAGRPWYKNPYWAPGMESGYAAETLPELRGAAKRGEAELNRAVEALAQRLESYRDVQTDPAPD